MKIVKSEIVRRYDVRFSPNEVIELKRHPRWAHVISTSSAEHNGRVFRDGTGIFGCATLTKKQINEVCDILGINGREFMSKVSLPAPSSTDVSLGLVDAKTGARR